MKKILIVIDMQKDFVNGALGTNDAVNIVPLVQQTVKRALEENTSVYFTQDTHTEQYMHTLEGKYLPIPHCIKDTEGWRIIPELQPFANPQNTIQKTTFGYTKWKEKIQDADRITLCGLCTDICVISNALILRALFPNTEIEILADACAGTNQMTHQAALTTANRCQILITKTAQE